MPMRQRACDGFSVHRVTDWPCHIVAKDERPLPRMNVADRASEYWSCPPSAWSCNLARITEARPGTLGVFAQSPTSPISHRGGVNISRSAICGLAANVDVPVVRGQLHPFSFGETAVALNARRDLVAAHGYIRTHIFFWLELLAHPRQRKIWPIQHVKIIIHFADWGQEERGPRSYSGSAKACCRLLLSILTSPGRRAAMAHLAPWEKRCARCGAAMTSSRKADCLVRGIAAVPMPNGRRRVPVPQLSLASSKRFEKSRQKKEK